MYRGIAGQADALPWASWPAKANGLTESGSMFSNDVSVLSIIRAVVQRKAGRVQQTEQADDFLMRELSGQPGVVVLQLGSILDQLGFVSLSAEVFRVGGDFPTVPPQFLLRINKTLSRQNQMKGKFFPNLQATCSAATTNGGLDKFRQKLAKMILFKQRACPEYSPVSSEGEEEDQSPAGIYFRARRGEKVDVRERRQEGEAEGKEEGREEGKEEWKEEGKGAMEARCQERHHQEVQGKPLDESPARSKIPQTLSLPPTPHTEYVIAQTYVHVPKLAPAEPALPKVKTPKRALPVSTHGNPTDLSEWERKARSDLESIMRA